MISFNPLSPFPLDFTGTGGGGGGGPAERYVSTFNATTDWGSPSGGSYSITVLQATHTRGTNPNIQVYENNAGIYSLVSVNVEVNGSGDVTINVNEIPDLRFAGAILII